MTGLTPMMQQYFEIKNKHKDHILLYRLGDFYELFFDDALLVSKELELTLTGRDCGQAERAPMCGVPHHKVDFYIGKLVELGYKVAICEQTEDAAEAKGLVRREVVRVVTPGTIVESSLLCDSTNNFLGAVYIDEGEIGVGFADISTGQVYATAFIGSNAAAETKLTNELSVYMPREVILNLPCESRPTITKFLQERVGALITDGQADRFVPDTDIIDSQFPKNKNKTENAQTAAVRAVCAHGEILNLSSRCAQKRKKAHCFGCLTAPKHQWARGFCAQGFCSLC